MASLLGFLQYELLEDVRSRAEPIALRPWAFHISQIAGKIAAALYPAFIIFPWALP